MKALVLTYDPQIGLAELVVRSYDIWLQERLFEFRVPVNALQPAPDFDSVQTVRFVRCAPDVRATMEALLADTDDDEWVFWAIDDRFPVWIDRERFVALFHAVQSGAFGAADGVKLLRWREELRDEPPLQLDVGRFQRQQPAAMFGFWHHHFLRARVLKRFFLDPALAPLKRLRQLHQHFQVHRHLDFLDRVFVPVDANLVHLDEPLTGGKLTRNGLAALQRLGCSRPDYPVSDVSLGFHDVDRQLLENPRAPKFLLDKQP